LAIRTGTGPTASVPVRPAMPRNTSTPPATSRMTSSPIPGNPVANVENSRRKGTLCDVNGCPISGRAPEEWCRPPRRVVPSPLSSRLQLDDAALDPDHRRVRPIRGSELGQDVLDAAFHGVFRDLELVGDLLVRVPRGDQLQDVDFRLRKGIVGGV